MEKQEPVLSVEDIQSAEIDFTLLESMGWWVLKEGRFEIDFPLLFSPPQKKSSFSGLEGGLLEHDAVCGCLLKGICNQPPTSENQTTKKHQ